MPHRSTSLLTSAGGTATARLAGRRASLRSVATLTLALSTLLAVTMLLALPAQAQAQAQSYAGDVTENRFNPRSLLAPSNRGPSVVGGLRPLRPGRSSPGFRHTKGRHLHEWAVLPLIWYPYEA